MAATPARVTARRMQSFGRKVTVAALAATLVVAAGASTAATHPTSGAAAAHGQFSVDKWGDSLADKVARNVLGLNVPLLDPGSLYTIENAIGARKVWLEKDASNRQITGQGVGVALLDSGTAQVPGLNGAGKVTYGPDLSIEGNGALTDQDTFGHGTHMAGIIAAHDSTNLLSNLLGSLDPSIQMGVAPDARLLSLKLATTDGSADVSQVIAALNWVTEHQTMQDGTKVRVINLSFGTDSIQPYLLDPLAAAAENAWRHGLVVVVSAGNDGRLAAQLTDPAIDPYVLAVGASDGADSVLGLLSPTVASFTNGGNASRHVDLLAPGTSIASLRDPGSYVDVNYPEGRVLGDRTGRLFRGSGTSQAAAVVSGAVALVLQANPLLTPDQVKTVLTATTTPVRGATAMTAGAGELNVASAVDAAKRTGGGASFVGVAGHSAASSVQNWTVSTGLGSLDAARGGSSLVDPDGVPLVGEVDVQGNLWNAAAWSAAMSAGTSWSGGNWMGVRWSGDGWDPSTGGLSSSRWSSSRWSSSRWSDADWSSSRWSSSRWSSSRWSSSRWSDAYWE